MNRDPWRVLPYSRHDKIWTLFEEAFRFTPSVDTKEWPSFREPAPSATWDISDLLATFTPWIDQQATPYNRALLLALQQCIPPDEPVFALDWQHTSYEFYPHQFRGADEPRNWCIPALPSGEYHLFVTGDHRLGSLGHPWEKTVCVFGAGFLDVYLQLTPLRPERIVRRQASEAEDVSPRRSKRGSQSCPRKRSGRRGK